MDIVTAFFYCFLDKNIFVNQPEQYVIDVTLVYHHQKALYGLKQAPFVWYALLSQFLQGLRFTKTDMDYSVFASYDKSTFISVYMDDLLIIGKEQNIINGLNNKLLEYFHMTDLGSVFHYLDMSVIQTRDFVSLNQKSYLGRVSLQFGMNTCKPPSSLIDPGFPNSMLPASKN